MEFIVLYGDLDFFLALQCDVNIIFRTALCSRYVTLFGNSEFCVNK